jgi:hypothetical protein
LYIPSVLAAGAVNVKLVLAVPPGAIAIELLPRLELQPLGALRTILKLAVAQPPLSLFFTESV